MNKKIRDIKIKVGKVTINFKMYKAATTTTTTKKGNAPIAKQF